MNLVGKGLSRAEPNLALTGTNLCGQRDESICLSVFIIFLFIIGLIIVLFLPCIIWFRGVRDNRRRTATAAFPLAGSNRAMAALRLGATFPTLACNAGLLGLVPDVQVGAFLATIALSRFFEVPARWVVLIWAEFPFEALAFEVKTAEDFLSIAARFLVPAVRARFGPVLSSFSTLSRAFRP